MCAKLVQYILRAFPTNQGQYFYFFPKQSLNINPNLNFADLRGVSKVSKIKIQTKNDLIGLKSSQINLRPTILGKSLRIPIHRWDPL